jgi:DNA-binding transcriptional MerR regulator
MDRGHIDITAAADEFGLKVRTMREYRRLRIIVPVKRIRGKDYFILSEVKRANMIVDDNSFKNLTEIAEIVIEDREIVRKRKQRNRTN